MGRTKGAKNYNKTSRSGQPRRRCFYCKKRKYEDELISGKDGKGEWAKTLYKCKEEHTCATPEEKKRVINRQPWHFEVYWNDQQNNVNKKNRK